MGKIYFNQMDSRWANKMYSSVNNPNQTIKTSGCGPTSGAMVVSSLTGNMIYPDELADYYVKNGYRTPNNGTSWSAFYGTAEKYGLEFKQTADINTAIDCLNLEGIVVATTPGGNTSLFSTNGHFVVLTGINNNIFTIYDSYLYKGKYDTPNRKGKATVNRNEVYVSVENTKKEINQYFCFYGKRDIVNNINTKAKYVKVNTALNIRSGPGTNYEVLGTLSNNTLVTVYEESNGFSKIGEEKWVSSEYLQDNPSVVTQNRVMTVTPKIGVNVREKPSTSSKIITAYRQGTKVTIYEIKNGWARGIKGWIYALYLK